MADEIFTLPELMLYADQFLNRIAAVSEGNVKGPEFEELRLKIGQSRNILALLQSAFEEDKLSIGDRTVQEQFRSVLLILHWVAFYARTVLERRTFRKLVMIEAGFTRLLIKRVRENESN